jgi:preprotein translocase subunit SecG
MLTLALNYWVTASLVAVFLFVCVLMILAVLIQRPAGGGLSGAFGSGAGSGQTAFGAKTGDALTIATIAIFVVYLLFAIGLNFATRPATTKPGATPTAQEGAASPEEPATTGSPEATPTGAATGATSPAAPTAPTGARESLPPLPPAPTAAPEQAPTAPTGAPAPTTPPAPATGATGPT